jgi:DNA modification methylase
MDLEDNSVDLVLTSPPYPGATMWSLPDESIQDNIERLTQLNLDVLRECARVVRENGCIAWNIADIPWGDHGVIQNTSTITHFAAQELGLKWRNHIIWDKGSSNLPPPAFMRRPAVCGLTHEHIYVWFKGDWVPREKTIDMPQDMKRWCAFSVWKISPKRDKDHIAPFPYELARRAIQLWSLPGETVLDPFSGSGTVLKVCADLEQIGEGRDAIGIDIDPKYANLSSFRSESKAPPNEGEWEGTMFEGL